MADQAVVYAVMRAVPWDGIEVHGVPMQSPPDGPQRFIPVFDTEEQAVAFASDGDRIMAFVLRTLGFGGRPENNTISFRPPMGRVPNRFVRFMMRVCFDCLWVDESNPQD